MGKYHLPKYSADWVMRKARPLSQNATTVLTKRYLDRNDNGIPNETTDELYWRVAHTLALIEENYNHGGQDSSVAVAKWSDRFFKLMRGYEFLPNSPTLANAGTRTAQLSACFVLPISDSFSNRKDGIYDTLTKAQLIQQTGGGVGYSFSRLRAKGQIVNTTKGVSSGPVSFMDVYDAACGAIKQGGVRRGAQMSILRCDHPDIEEFINYKQDLTKLTNFNVSVAITNEFLQTLKDSETYELIDPSTGPTGKFLNAKYVWEKIIQRAWATGEPGVVFLDRMNNYNPTPKLGPYEATNPCGEQPLNPYESCNLGSITLDTFVTAEGRIDFDRLKEVVHSSIRFMDNIVDANAYVPLVPEIRETTLKTRKLGLGIMGLARMLFKLGVAYDSHRGRSIAEEVYAFIDVQSKLASINLAKERGAFPYYQENKQECEAFYIQVWDERAQKARVSNLFYIAEMYYHASVEMQQFGIRNSTTTTIAPTGTLSILHDTSGGCEPEFALVISRRQADTEMFEANPVLEQALKTAGYKEEEIRLIYNILGKYRGSLKEALAAGVLNWHSKPKLEQLAEVFMTAGDISPEDHVLMQAATQKYNDSATSKTINFPREATVEQVAAAYDLAIETDCKGITIYRDGCRDFQPLTAGKKEEKKEPTLEQELSNRISDKEPRKRSDRLYGFTQTINTGDGKLYATINYDARGIREVVAQVGRSGGTLNSMTEAIGRLISLALQYNVPIKEIIHKLIGIRSANVYGFGPAQVLSIPDALAKVLNKSPNSLQELITGEGPDEVLDEVTSTVAVGAAEMTSRSKALDLGESPECPNCSSVLKFESGCKGGTCTNPDCGWAKC